MQETPWSADSSGCPFRLLSISWPRPAQCDGDRWTSQPEWNAPIMPLLPRWSVRAFQGRAYHVLDWRETFGGDVDVLGNPRLGEMRGFYVVFHLRVEYSGSFTVVETGGSIVRRNGEIVHESRCARDLREHKIQVAIGDHVVVAQWQPGGEWYWGVRRVPVQRTHDAAVAIFASYTSVVEEALRRPNGPHLKVYTNAAQPLRSVLSIYSLVLNGYRPSGIQVFGDYQWQPPVRHLMTALLPFADIVSIKKVDSMLDAIDERLKPLAHRAWYAMKLCVSLFIPPHDYCFLDDDVFVLDSLDDALALREDYELVYAPDADYQSFYRASWCPDRMGPLPTGNINLGLYFLRTLKQDSSRIDRLLRTPPEGHRPLVWEQGFMASEFADARTVVLSTQRYFYPVFDGLPGGLLGYDWTANPCGFAAIHFGGPTLKPDNRLSCVLIREILGRRRVDVVEGKHRSVLTAALPRES